MLHSLIFVGKTLTQFDFLRGPDPVDISRSLGRQNSEMVLLCCGNQMESGDLY